MRSADGEKSAERRKVAWAIIGSAVIAGMLSAAAVLAIDRPHRVGVGVWISDFAKSPGLAGIAAVTAAGVALWGIMKQVAEARKSLQHQQSTEQNRAWWARFEWAASRALPTDPSHAALPWPAVLSTFNALVLSADDDVQRTAVGAIMQVAGEREQPSHGSALAIPARTPHIDDTVRSALQTYVNATSGTPAQSRVVEAMLYEVEVLGALQRVFGDSLIVPESSGRTADAILTRDGASVVVEIKAYTASPGPISVARLIATVRSLVSDSRAQGAIIVSPMAVRLPAGSQPRDISVAVWRSEADDNALRQALDDLR